MLRMNGSAQTARRWTKGGSLSRSRETGVSQLTSDRANGASKPAALLVRNVILGFFFSHDGVSSQNGRNDPQLRVSNTLSSHNRTQSPAPDLSTNRQDSFVSNQKNIEDRSARLPLWKRVLDLALVFASFPLWLPLMIFLMVLVKLGSSGPIFYRQERVGYRGKLFMIFKFRSMKVDAETNTHEEHFANLMGNNSPMTKLDAAGDPRLIPLGRIFRATGMDELPQLFNVIHGDMSLVGPRPCLPYEFQRYQPWQQERVNAAPGLTGYWQVNGKNKTTFSEMIEMDILYSRKMSLWLDLTIIFKTVPAIIQQVLEAQTRARTEHAASETVRREASRLTT
jgi:lipopolysaccharide/colanic/teichoic acid biosynthesis glycosyltransferase